MILKSIKNEFQLMETKLKAERLKGKDILKVTTITKGVMENLKGGSTTFGDSLTAKVNKSMKKNLSSKLWLNLSLLKWGDYV